MEKMENEPSAQANECVFKLLSEDGEERAIACFVSENVRCAALKAAARGHTGKIRLKHSYKNIHGATKDIVWTFQGSNEFVPQEKRSGHELLLRRTTRPNVKLVSVRRQAHKDEPLVEAMTKSAARCERHGEEDKSSFH